MAFDPNTMLDPNAGLSGLPGNAPPIDMNEMMAQIRANAPQTSVVPQAQPLPIMPQQALPVVPQQIQQQSTDPNGIIGQILGQVAQNRQDQGNQNGLIQSILSNRFQPSDGDTGQSIIRTAQSFGDPSQFSAVTPDQVAASRVQNQLAPYTAALGLQNAAQTAQNAPAMAQADLAYKQAQTRLANSQSGGLFGNLSGNGAGAATADGPHGDQFLSTLEPQTAGIVKALATGRMQFPSGMALKTPQWQQMMLAVSQYDPQFDAVNYNARAGIRKDFTSGKDAQTINALNTGIGHLDQLSSAIPALNNGSIPALNSIENFISTQTGGTGPSNFQAIKNSVAPELVRIWRGSGGSEGDIQGRLADLDAAKSPDQLNGVIKELADLMKSKIDALGDQYQRGMGTAAQDTNFYSPKSQQIFQKLGIDVSNGQSSAQQPQTQSSGITEGQTGTLPSGQKVIVKNGQIVPVQ